MSIQARRTTASMRLLAVLLTATLVAGMAPAAASAITETQSLEVAEKFISALVPQAEAPSAASKMGADASVSEARAPYTTPLARAKAPLPEPAPVPGTTARGTRTVSASGTTRSSAGAAKPAAPSSTGAGKKGTGAKAKAAAPAAPDAPASSGDTLSRARSVLASRISMYPILRGASVDVGDTKGNGQAICYYKSGRIIINANHTASIERIIDHEIWHIIDWRDNGKIDWGESIPPSNAASFRG